ncbi:MAG TPA: cytidine deaminase [Pseudonocardiaceae bacterium]|nr:cytidine deaminase [Pseudonocardiaceae bacterium]
MPETADLDSADVNPADLDPEDAKIVTLARSAQTRTGAEEGAAVRDTEGRTYTGCTVSLPSLALTALQAAVAAAVASGATGLEAAAVVSGSGSVDAVSLAAVRELGPRAAVLLANQRGALTGVLRAAG